VRYGRGKAREGARLVVLTALILCAFATIVLRLLALQGMSAPHWVRQAAIEHERTIRAEGERGSIFDRNGQPLAVNVEVPSVFAVPSLIEDAGSVARRLAAALGESQTSLLKRLKTGKDFVWVRRKVEPGRLSAIRPMAVQGVGIVMESQRIYPKHALLGQTLGFADVDNRGLEGIERRYDPVLQGERGKLTFERDALGKIVFPKDLSYRSPARGKDLYLTIDEVIQYISERELDRALESTQAAAGTVIVMDPQTGEILSLAVRPRFNPNDRNAHSPDQWRNRAIGDLYEPGSTFKIVVAAAALEEGAVRPEEAIFCENGTMSLPGRSLHDHTPSGWLSFQEVIAKSSNIGTAKVAIRLGADRLSRYIASFGFGERTGIDLPGEITGKIRPLSEWSERSLAMVAIGQEVGVTPIQMISAMGAIANGGYLLTPRVTLKVSDGEGGSETFGRSVRKRVISKETSRRMVAILEAVAGRGGTGERAAMADYRVAGKTGTAQKIDPVTRRYAPDRFVSSFVGFAPADDPRLVILVVIDEPKGVSWGGSVAAPVFRAIGEEALHYLGVSPRAQPSMVLARARLEAQ
jgi:cell division protein FtsI (penicillin-binding protein 3)